MELKYGRERGVAKGTDSSNRTFMELKYSYADAECYDKVKF